MREATSEARLFIAAGAAVFGLCCAVGAAAGDQAAGVAELLSSRRWMLVAIGVGMNLGMLAIMRKFIGLKAAAVFVAFLVGIAASLLGGFRWLQVQVPVAFWLGDAWVMTVAYVVLVIRARRRAAMQPDVQSSFLASRLSK